MHFLTNLFLGLWALSPSLAQAVEKIQWTGPCSLNQTVPLICGTLKVPMDYTDKSSNETLTLQLRKIAGKNKSPGGKSILFNPGGPGESSLDAINSTGPELHAILGEEIDLVTFNTRGVGTTIPFSCYNTDSERLAALSEAPICTNASDTAAGAAWSSATNLADNCYAYMNETGGLYGTAFIARDMMQIVDALEEDGLLHYWGFSYGTVLGATVAAMFPDRIGSIVLDGVLNPFQYYYGYDNEQTTDTDAVFSGFCAACFETPSLCPLSALASSGPDLEVLLYDLLDDLKYHPVPLETSLMEYSTIKAQLFQYLYSTDLWPALSSLLYSVATQNITALAMTQEDISSASPTAKEALQGIKCSDKTVRALTFEDFEPVINEAYNLSQIGGDINTYVNMQCAQWNVSAKERYGGDFHVKTRNPVLVIGNTYDPATPFISAKNASETFEGSVLLRHNGHGHASIGQPSVCTGKVVRDYFQNGTLPEEGKVCEPSIPPFSSETWENVFLQRRTGESEDALMLRALMGLRGS